MKRKRVRPISIQSLEERRVMASFGTPWPEPRSLSVSFPSDQAQIGAYDNVLRATLDQVTDRREWQETVLRAFQTWAVETNLNIGLSTDRGDHFGAVGLSKGDPRFGDFRIGAFPQDGVLANALPFQTSSGTWAGDVLLNSQTNFFLGDWRSDAPVNIPEANEKGTPVELYSVLLHEAGNALGLADQNRPGAVMHETYEGPKGKLTEEDIRAVTDLYGGARKDIYEPVRNDRRRDATRISYPLAFDGGKPVTIRGSLNSIADIDHYSFVPLAAQQKVTVRLNASGISLLRAHLYVTDAAGNTIADAKADSIFENDLRLEIGSLSDHKRLFIRVEGNGDDVFSVGDYQIELDYRPQELQTPIQPLRFDADADDDDDKPIAFDPSQTVDAIFSRHGLVDSELGLDDSIPTSTRLESIPGFLTATRYEALAAIGVNDVDVYSFTTPVTLKGSITVKLESLGIDSPTLLADVLDAKGQRVNARVTTRPDGSVAFELIEPLAATEYFVRVQASDQTVVRTGNYVITIDTATQPAQMTELIAGSLAIGQANWVPVSVLKTQLFRFDLQTLAADRDLGISIAVYDARTANVIASFAAAGGATVTEFLWLQRGDYYVRVESLARVQGAVLSVAYRLLADGISDDQGPLPIDPTNPYGGTIPITGTQPTIVLAPNPYAGQNPYLPNPTSTTSPTVTQPITYQSPPLQNPWYFNPYYFSYQYNYRP